MTAQGTVSIAGKGMTTTNKATRVKQSCCQQSRFNSFLKAGSDLMISIKISPLLRDVTFSDVVLLMAANRYWAEIFFIVLSKLFKNVPIKTQEKMSPLVHIMFHIRLSPL